jgi:hypothetical protein
MPKATNITLDTPQFTRALRQHPAAKALTSATLMRRLAGNWPAGTALLWNNPDLLAAWLCDAFDASGIQVDQELFDSLLNAREKGA